MSYLKNIFNKEHGAIHFLLVAVVGLLLMAGYFYTQNKSILGTQTPELDQLLRVDNIPSSSSDYIYTYAMKADNSGHVYIYWTENAAYPTPDRALFRVSNDFGKTFSSNAINIPTPSNTNILSASRILYPKMCTDENGHVYLLREYRTSSWSKDPVKVYINTSSDYGKTWLTQDIALSHWNQAPNEIIAQETTFPQISCDENGHIYVVWSDERDGPYNLFFNYSSDYGKTWLSQEIKITQGVSPTGGWTTPQISSDQSGNVYITWQSLRGTKVDIYANSSNDFGKTWGQPIRVDTAPDNAQLFTPAISSDDYGNVYIGWRQKTTSNNNYMYFNYSSNYGKTWQNTPQRIDHDPPTSDSINQLTPMPLLTSNNFGYVFALWEEIFPLKPFLNYSSDRGKAWNSEVNIDNRGGGSIRETSLSSDNTGHVYSTFEFDRNIYFNYSSDNSENWLPTSIQLDSLFSQGTEQYGYPYQANPYLAHDDNGHAYVLFGDHHFKGFGLLPAYLYLQPITVPTTFSPPPIPSPTSTPLISPSPTPIITPNPSPTGIGTTNPSLPTPPPQSCGLPCSGRSHKDPPKTDGTGWIKVNINAQKAVYVPTLPRDPLNNNENHYVYCADSEGWELAVKLESEKNKQLMENDGGDDPTMLELGSNLKLVNIVRGCEY